MGKDVVSRVWRKVKTDWEAWNRRDLSAEPIVRLILDGTVVRVRLNRKATAISLLVVIGVRDDGQRVLLAVRKMGGETAEAWRVVLNDLMARGLRRPDFLIVNGGAGLDQALAAFWTDVPTQRFTVHKHRNLLSHAPEKLRHRPMADSLEEAGDRLFTFTRLPPGQWERARASNAIERLHEEFKRTHQDPDGAALIRHRRRAVLGGSNQRLRHAKHDGVATGGFDGLRPDHDAQGRRVDFARHSDR